MWDVDGDNFLDQQITDGNVQDGVYHARVWSTPATPGGAHFSLPVEVEAQSLLFTCNAAVPAAGDTVDFAIPFGAAQPVFPRSGSFTVDMTPTFDWSQAVAARNDGATLYGIQIDDSWGFPARIYEIDDLTAPQFTPADPLVIDTLYYWRYRICDGAEWGEYSDFYAVNIVACHCPLQGNIDADLWITVLDLAKLADVLFAGGLDPQDLTCPTTRSDFDADGSATALDLAALQPIPKISC